MSSSKEKAVDSIQKRLTDYSLALRYEAIPPEVVQAAKMRIIDTLGVTLGGFHGEITRIARDMAAQIPNPDGASLFGTRIRTTPDLAAFANGTAARQMDMLDVYHRPGSYHGHGSDTLLPVLAAAEHMHASGRDFITAVLLSYEVMCRFCDVFPNRDFDNTSFASIATAAAAGKLFGLTHEQLGHAIAMAAVPNVILRQVRMGHSMWKLAAAGQAGRAGVFAVMLARAGMEGPHLPFEGKAGWCDHVAHQRFTLGPMGGDGDGFRLPETLIKLRPAMSETLASVLAAEDVARQLQGKAVAKVRVETYEKAFVAHGSGEHRWAPDTKLAATQSIPCLVAAALLDGQITVRTFNGTRLEDPRLKAMMARVEVTANPEFTALYKGPGHQHHARITIETTEGARVVGASGGGSDDLSNPKTDAQIEEKFRMLTEDFLGSRRVTDILQQLHRLEQLDDIGAVPAMFALV